MRTIGFVLYIFIRKCASIYPICALAFHIANAFFRFNAYRVCIRSIITSYLDKQNFYGMHAPKSILFIFNWKVQCENPYEILGMVLILLKLKHYYNNLSAMLKSFTDWNWNAQNEFQHNIKVFLRCHILLVLHWHLQVNLMPRLALPKPIAIVHLIAHVFQLLISKSFTLDTLLDCGIVVGVMKFQL